MTRPKYPEICRDINEVDAVEYIRDIFAVIDRYSKEMQALEAENFELKRKLNENQSS